MSYGDRIRAEKPSDITDGAGSQVCFLWIPCWFPKCSIEYWQAGIFGPNPKSNSWRSPGGRFEAFLSSSKVAPEESPGGRFKGFLAPGPKTTPRSLQEAVLKHFWPAAQK